MHYDGDGWATAVKPQAGCSREVNLHTDAGDEGIVDSGCSRSMTGNKERLDDYSTILKGSLQDMIVLSSPRFQTPSERHGVIQSSKEAQCGIEGWSVNYKNMNKLVKDNLVRGLPPKLFKNDHTCVACCKGKQHKATYKAITAVSSISEPLQLLHMDLFGPTSIRSIDHKYYCLVITDDYSRFCWVFFLETKDETYPILKDFISLLVLNAKLIQLCGEKGIKRDYNVLITTIINKTPYALLTGKTPSISHFKPFGCHVTILNTSDHLGKFDGKADEGYLVRYSASNRAYRVYNMANKRVEESMNLRFLEEKANIQGIGHEWSFDLDYLTDSLGYNRDKANQSVGTQDVSSNPAGFQDDDSDSDSDEQVILWDTAEDIFQQELAVLTGGVPVPSGSPTDSFFDAEPTTRFSSPSDLGNNAEMQQFKFQNVWLLVDLPEGKYAIGTKCEYSKQRDAWGIVVRIQARLDSLGHRQVGGMIMMKSLAPVARIEACRLFLAFAFTLDLWYIQMDVKSGFFMEALLKVVYVLNLRVCSIPNIPKKWMLQAQKRYHPGTSLCGIDIHLLITYQKKRAWCDEFEALMKGEFEMSAMGELIFFKDLMESLSAKTISALSGISHSYYIHNLYAGKKIFKYLKGQPKSQLQLADDGGIDDLPIAEIYSRMDNLRFLQTILGIETSVARQYRVFKLSSKLFANMKLNFEGQPMPLLAAMLSQAQAGEGAGVAGYKLLSHYPPEKTIPKTRLNLTNLKTIYEPLGGSFHASPPRSTQAPPAGHTSGGAEDLITLTALSSVVSTLVQKVNSLETELKAHKKLFKDVVGKLVKKVKAMEVKLKTKKRKVVIMLLVHHIPTDIPTERTKKQLADKGLSEIEAARLEALERERSEKEKAEIARQDAIYTKQLEQEEEMSASQRETRQAEVLSSAKHSSDADWIAHGQVHAIAEAFF
ncbi:putative ribonuclease H-like domain-containing protein [Tanacetum coccineum]